MIVKPLRFFVSFSRTVIGCNRVTHRNGLLRRLKKIVSKKCLKTRVRASCPCVAAVRGGLPDAYLQPIDFQLVVNFLQQSCKKIAKKFAGSEKRRTFANRYNNDTQ